LRCRQVGEFFNFSVFIFKYLEEANQRENEKSEVATFDTDVLPKG
jgi:hypothetical protein